MRVSLAAYIKIKILVVFLIQILILNIAPTPANAEMVQGVVVVGERGCKKYDVIVIQTNLGYVIAEVFSGMFDKGDIVVGDLNSFGFHDVLVNGMSGNLYIDDYFLGRNDAAKKCFRD